MTLVYFAYGSNMLSRRLQARVPSARPAGIARLPGHRLVWHMQSSDGSGKCDVHADPAADEGVWGVLYRMAADEKHHLDRAESLGHGYDEHEHELHTEQGPVRAFLYKALLIEPALRPYHWYKGFVVEGAREHGLPAHYLGQLDAIASLDDPDPERARANLRLLGGG